MYDISDSLFNTSNVVIFYLPWTADLHKLKNLSWLDCFAISKPR